MMSAQPGTTRCGGWARTRRQRIYCRGQTLVEYGLILVMVSIVAISVLISMSGKVDSIYSKIDSEINSSQQGVNH